MSTLLKELKFSQSATLEKKKTQVPFIPADAGPWIGEMEEIPTTFREAGVTGSFHDGAAEVLKILAQNPFSNESRETMDHTRGLEEVVNEYVKHLTAEKIDE